MLNVIETLPVILKVIETLPVIIEVLSPSNFETTDLFTNNFEFRFEIFMMFIIFGFLLLFIIQTCTTFSDDIKILS